MYRIEMPEVTAKTPGSEPAPPDAETEQPGAETEQPGDEEDAQEGLGGKRRRGRRSEDVSESCWTGLFAFEVCDSCGDCDLFGTNLILMLPALAAVALRGEMGARRRGAPSHEPWVPQSMQSQAQDCTLRPGTRASLAALRTYKRVISSRTPNVCHHSVSCSEYAAVLIREQGAVRALPGIRARLKSCAAASRQESDRS
ncbi:MAG: membrane protein insertion efficiency factor YidD [Actinomycetes bacterium]